MDYALAVAAGLGVLGLLVFTYPYWPRHGAGPSGDALSASYERGVALLNRIAKADSGDPVVGSDDDVKDAVLPFLMMSGRGTREVPPLSSLSKSETRVLSLCHGARVMSAAALRRACARVTGVERRLAEESRAIYVMEDSDFLARIREVLGDFDSSAVAGSGETIGQSVPATQSGDAVNVHDTSEPATEAPSEIDADSEVVTDTADILDLISYSAADPDLWHFLIDRLDISNPHVPPIYDWILRQPNCDRATAALALLRADVGRLMKITASSDCPDALSARWHVVRSLCERSEGFGFVRNELNLSSAGEDDDQHDFLVHLAGVAADMLIADQIPAWPLPESLLDTPFEGRDPIVHFGLAEGGLTMESKADQRPGEASEERPGTVTEENALDGISTEEVTSDIRTSDEMTADISVDTVTPEGMSAGSENPVDHQPEVASEQNAEKQITGQPAAA